MKTKLFLWSLVFLLGCQQTSPSNIDAKPPVGPHTSTTVNTSKLVNPLGSIIATRFPPPLNFDRIVITDTNSFAYYLRHLPLKPDGAAVLYHNGQTKPNNGIYKAVVDLPIGKKDLHQCADAIMRLRAEYLFEQKTYQRIQFNFTNGFPVNYSIWRQGNRVVVDGNKTYWKKKTIPSNSYQDFWVYLETVFTYAGTYSLAKELKAVAINDLKIGDVFIQGGFPGHAVIVVDMAVHPNTGERLFMLAQSYMPAQELQILTNPLNSELSPWYTTNFDKILNTPEWAFSKENLKRF